MGNFSLSLSLSLDDITQLTMAVGDDDDDDDARIEKALEPSSIRLDSENRSTQLTEINCLIPRSIQKETGENVSKTRLEFSFR